MPNAPARGSCACEELQELAVRSGVVQWTDFWPTEEGKFQQISLGAFFKQEYRVVFRNVRFIPDAAHGAREIRVHHKGRLRKTTETAFNEYEQGPWKYKGDSEAVRSGAVQERLGTLLASGCKPEEGGPKRFRDRVSIDLRSGRQKVSPRPSAAMASMS